MAFCPLLAAMLAGALGLTAEPSFGGQSIDIGAWVAALPTRYALSGFKNEPTYLGAIDIERDGDLFTITGGAPAWAERSTVSMRVTPAGDLVSVVCPKPMVCDDTVPAGFLATASLLAAARKGVALGTGTTVPFGERQVVCVPGDRLGVVRPILDPCFDTLTGAVLAQRHRLSGAFDGPTLDPWSVRFSDEGRGGAS